MSRDLKPTERLVQIGQTALRAPDGSFLPAQPLYITSKPRRTSRKTSCSAQAKNSS